MKTTSRVSSIDETNLSRRRFVKGIAAGSALVGLGLHLPVLHASPNLRMRQNVLSGNEFDLTIGEQSVNFTGQQRIATTVNNSLPAPILRWKEGEMITLRVKNTLDVDSSIHWHGLILPAEMDGVPGLSFKGIAPGETFTYQFKANQSGTYWYHSHSGFQEQTGLYGAIIIDPKEPEHFQYDRDYTIVLSDWSDEKPETIFRKLKKKGHYYNFNERTSSDLIREIKEKGLSQTWADREMWNQMRMSDRDLSDVTGYTYTFLMNGLTPADHWRAKFKPGEKVLLRFVNAGAMTFFDVRIPGLKMTVVAADGQYIQPVAVDEFRIGSAETYDVIVEPKDDRAYSLFAQAIDRSGYACGSLTPDMNITAEVPELDHAPVLGHSDMGMAQHDQHSAHSSAMESHDHHAGHDMGAMHSTMDHSAMGHSQHAPPSDKPVTHKSTEYGPHVDMRAENPQYRLDDPGVGLRNNGRHVLTYADLRNYYHAHHVMAPSREIELHLTGNMSRYMWSIDGIPSDEAPPILLKYGERVRVTLVNDTMMNHPVHLHGMWSELETGDMMRLPKKHTVIVQPGAKISYQVTADAKGDWAFHCHLLYHMMGMFRTVSVV